MSTTYLTDLSNYDLTLAEKATISFSGVNTLTFEEYKAVKNTLSDTTNGLGEKFNNKFILDFGDATIIGLNENNVVNTKTENNTLADNGIEIFVNTSTIMVA